MPRDRIEGILLAELKQIEAEGRRKDPETVIAGVLPAMTG